MRLPLTRSELLALAGGLLLLAGSLLAIYQSRPGAAVALASAVSDTYYRFNPLQPSQDIVFVAVDHKAVKALGRWPWARDRIADGIRQCSQASVVALDMVFSEPTEATLDQTLGESLSAATTIGGFMLNGVNAGALDAAALAALANSALTDVTDPHLIESQVVELSIPEILAGQAALAALNTQADPDERFRHYPVAFVLMGMVLPNLGTQTLQVFLNETAQLRGGQTRLLSFGDRHLDLDDIGFTRLNLYPESSFNTLSFADLVEPGFDPARLAAKIVLIGVTEAGVSDIRATPLGQYPGPLMHATFISNALEGHGLRELRLPGMSASLIATLALTLLAILLRQAYQRALVYLVMAAGAYGLGLLLYLKAGIWFESAYPILGVVLSALLIETSLLSHARRHTDKIRSAFSNCLPPELVGRIVESPEKLKLGGEKKEITVLFSDIRGFTSMSESVSPEQLANIMTQYFNPMTEAIFEQGGTLDKFIGDAIMALFNAPLDQPDHPLAACRAAIAMQYAQLRINESLKSQGLPTLRTGIGINLGPAIVGNLGSSKRFNYTAIGDVVNLASRLESATKKLGVDIAIGESVYEAVKSALPCRPLGTVEVAGKEKPQPVYELCWRDCPAPSDHK